MEARCAPPAATMHSMIARNGRSLHKLGQNLVRHLAAVNRAHAFSRVAAASEGHGGDGGSVAAAALTRREASTVAAAVGSATSPSAASLAAKPAHLRQLSEEQLKAAAAPLGTIRVVAGPGSGKTRVLTARIAQLIHTHGAHPWQILAITFTNKAADEMKERLATMLGEEVAKKLFAGTFHGLCYRILKSHIRDLEHAGRDSSFTVYDQDMTLRLLANEVKRQNPDWKAKDVNQEASRLQGAISSAKNSMLTWHATTPLGVERCVREHLQRQAAAEDNPLKAVEAGVLAEWFGMYEAALRANNAVDFDDLLGLSVALLASNEAVRQRYHRRFRHVLVDEFQDTNATQYELVKLLAMPRADLFVVGDPDQSIYGWRGADMTNMTEAFVKDFPGAQVCDLQDNYRSSARIVATAQSVIAPNDEWQRKGMNPMHPAGDLIQVLVIELDDSQQEARYVAAEIAATLQRGDHPEEQVAVLFRTHAQSRLVEQELFRRGVRYVLVGGLPFWRRAEVQDVMAYLRLAVGLRDNIALSRIINTPRRGIGDTSLIKLQAAAAERGLTLCSLLFGDGFSSEGSQGSDEGSQGSGEGSQGGQGSCEQIKGSKGGEGGEGRGMQLPPLPDRKELGLPAKAATALEAFRQLMAELHVAVRTQPLHTALMHIVDRTGYEKYLLDGGLTTSASKQGDEAERVERIWQLLGAAADYSPGAMSGAVSLDEDYPEGGGGSGSTDNDTGSSDSDSDRESRLALRVTLIGTDDSDGDVEFSFGGGSEYSDFSDGDFGGTEEAEAETETGVGEAGAAGAGAAGGEGEEAEAAGRSEGGGGKGGAGTRPSMPPLQRAQNFLDEVALYSGADEGGAATPGVRLMTMHAAKGLEFELVYIPGCNDGLMPLLRGEPGAVDLVKHVAEERRLFYVSLTRAKQRLRILHTAVTSLYGAQSGRESDPCRFLAEVVEGGHAAVLQRMQGSPEAQDRSTSGRYPASSNGSSKSGSSKSGSSSGSSGGGSWQRSAGGRSSSSSGSTNNAGRRRPAPGGSSSGNSSSGSTAGSDVSSSRGRSTQLSSAEMRHRRGGRR
ncbi:ATP-dependent DNA helicase PcrA [Chlorella vulgaris]